MCVGLEGFKRLPGLFEAEASAEASYCHPAWKSLLGASPATSIADSLQTDTAAGLGVACVLFTMDRILTETELGVLH